MIVVLGGIAAAGAFWFASQNGATPESASAPSASAQAVAAAPTSAPVETVSKVAEPTPAPEVAAAPVETSTTASPTATAVAVAANPATSPAGGAAAPAVAVADNSPAAKPAPIATSGNVDVDAAIRERSGAGTKSADEATPASKAENTPSNVPDAPPQGKITSAMGKGKSAAKSCVAGADEPSQVSVTFASSGSVKSVNVSGWASGKSAAGCIKAAFQGLNVGPFSKPTFSTSTTIRP
jgi:hypothetical protein